MAIGRLCDGGRTALRWRSNGAAMAVGRRCDGGRTALRWRANSAAMAIERRCDGGRTALRAALWPPVDACTDRRPCG